MICYQNDSWIFATSTCNLENQNCTFGSFCAKIIDQRLGILAHFIQESLGRPTIRSVVDRPKGACTTDHRVSGRPTIAPMVDRPGKNISIILTNHGHFGLFSTSLKFERGRPRWILSDSRSTWKIQIVSKRMQNASNVSMWGGADRCTVKLQGTACVRTLTYPLFLQWDIRQKQ